MSQFKKVKYGYRVTEKKIPKNIKKVFGIATYISTVLEDINTDDTLELTILKQRTHKMMKVFGVQAGDYQYTELLDKLGDIWVELDERNKKTIKEQSIPMLIECMCMIIHPKDFKELFAVVPFVRYAHMYMIDYPEVVKSVLELDEELNMLLGTKSYSLIKPKEKIVKVKKQRDKSKKKVKEKIVSKSKLKEAERKAKGRNFLRDRVAQAKQVVGDK